MYDFIFWGFIFFIVLLQTEGLVLPEKWATLRPEALVPAQFVELTIDVYGEKGSAKSLAALERAREQQVKNGGVRESDGTVVGGEVPLQRRQVLAKRLASTSTTTSTTTGTGTSAEEVEEVEEEAAGEVGSSSSGSGGRSVADTPLAPPVAGGACAGASHVKRNLYGRDPVNRKKNVNAKGIDVLAFSEGSALATQFNSRRDTSSSDVGPPVERADKSMYVSDGVWRKAQIKLTD
jgi:hypothetical protein